MWFKNYTEITLGQFKKHVYRIIEEEFVLPEKWCVKVNTEFVKYQKEELLIINHIPSPYLSDKYYYCSIKNDYGYQHFHYKSQKFITLPKHVFLTKKDWVSHGYKEITLEQYKKYVINVEKEIMIRPTPKSREEIRIQNLDNRQFKFVEFSKTQLKEIVTFYLGNGFKYYSKLYDDFLKDIDNQHSYYISQKFYLGIVHGKICITDYHKESKKTSYEEFKELSKKEEDLKEKLNGVYFSYYELDENKIRNILSLCLENGFKYNLTDETSILFYARHPLTNYKLLLRNGQIQNMYDVPSYIKINYDDFLKLTTKKEEKMGTYRVTRKDMKQIYDVSCSQWKVKIIDKVEKLFMPLDDETFLTQEEVKEMFDAIANDKQREVFNSIFPDFNLDKNVFLKQDISLIKSKTDEYTKLLFGESSVLYILDRATPDDRKDLKGRAFYLSPGYSVNTGETPMGGTLQCQECNDVVDGGLFDRAEKVLFWYCKNHHRSQIPLDV